MDKNLFTYVMITCYYGKLGQGKTYALAEHALRELQRGRVVYANFFIYWHGVRPLNLWLVERMGIPANNLRYFNSVEQFMDMEDAFVALDEGWIYFDSYKMTSFPIEVRMKILQSRKDGLDIAYTTQRPEQVHKSLRAMTSEFYECEAGFYPFLKKPVFYRYDADLHNDTVKRNSALRWEPKVSRDGSTQWVPVEVEQKPVVIWPKQSVFDSFDTDQKIALSAAKGKLSHAPRPVGTVESKASPDVEDVGALELGSVDSKPRAFRKLVVHSLSTGAVQATPPQVKRLAVQSVAG